MKHDTRYEQIRQPSSYEVSAAHCREIGRIIVRWAYFEQYIQRIIWAVTLDGNPKGAKLGRVAVRETKPDEQLDLLKSVADIRGVKLDLSLLGRMKKAVKKLVEERNLLAHGVWANVPAAGWCVQQTRGAWEETSGSPKGSRKVNPQALPRSTEDLHQTVRELEALIADAKTLKGKIGE